MKKSILELCKTQIKAVQGHFDIGEYSIFTQSGYELWKRLSPILHKISDELKEMSYSSIWYLDDYPYNFIACERISGFLMSEDKPIRGGDIDIRLGRRDQGRFCDYTLPIPSQIETMTWEEVMKWVSEHNQPIVPKGWKLNPDGSIEREDWLISAIRGWN